MKNRTEENRRNLDMIAPTWTMLGLALTACGGGGGGGVSGRISPPRPINDGAPVARNERIPDIREAPRGSEPIMLTVGQNSIPDLYYRYEAHTFDDGTVSQENDAELRVPTFSVDADGDGDISQPVFEINGLVQTYTSPRIEYQVGGGSYTYSLRVIINDYILHGVGFTVDDLVDMDDSSSVARFDAVSLSSVWTVIFNEFDARGRPLGTSSRDTVTIDGVLGVDADGVPDGSIDISVSIYQDDVTGDLYFSSGSGRTFLTSDTITLNDGTGDDDDDVPDITFLGERDGTSYNKVVFVSNFAEDGFGNIEIVPSDGAIDSLPEVLIIDARGTTGDVHNTGHIWYHNGEVVEDATAVLFIAIERGRYHAEVGVDLDGDRIADILVETLPVDIA